MIEKKPGKRESRKAKKNAQIWDKRGKNIKSEIHNIFTRFLPLGVEPGPVTGGNTRNKVTGPPSSGGPKES